MTDEERKLIAETPITVDCFEMDDYVNVPCFPDDDYWGMNDIWKQTIIVLETLRQKYNETKNKYYWRELIRLLPNSYKVVKL